MGAWPIRSGNEIYLTPDCFPPTAGAPPDESRRKNGAVIAGPCPNEHAPGQSASGVVQVFLCILFDLGSIALCAWLLVYSKSCLTANVHCHLVFSLVFIAFVFSVSFSFFSFLSESVFAERAPLDHARTSIALFPAVLV